MTKELGRVVQVFERKKIGVIELTDGPLKVGDQIRVTDIDGELLFDQIVDGIQVNHKAVEEANVPDCIGIILEKAIDRNARVFLV